MATAKKKPAVKKVVKRTAAPKLPTAAQVRAAYAVKTPAKRKATVKKKAAPPVKKLVLQSKFEKGDEWEDQYVRSISRENMRELSQRAEGIAGAGSWARIIVK